MFLENDIYDPFCNCVCCRVVALENELESKNEKIEDLETKIEELEDKVKTVCERVSIHMKVHENNEG